MKVEKRIWDFIQRTHEIYKSEKTKGFTFLKDIVITSIDNYYLVHCYDTSKRASDGIERKLSFKITIEHKLFGKEPDYRMSDILSCNLHSSIGTTILSDQVWEFMIPIVRDINLDSIGIN